jgi:uncharacterized membrane protein YbaN (DUF454 family)
MPAPPPNPAPVTDEPQLSRPVRWLLKGVAVASLALGVVGIFLPIVPTVPFVLLAAWAATKSSPRLTHWLENHPRMGPPIRQWRQGGVVNRGAKWWATTMMSAGALFMMVAVRPLWVPLTVTAIMLAVGTWLWLRPEQPPPGVSPGQ